LTDNPLCCSCWYRRSQSTSKPNRLYLQPSYCRSSRPHTRGSHRSHPAVLASHSAIPKVGHGIPTDTSQQRSLPWFPSPFPSYWLPASTRQSLRLVTEFLQLHRTLTAVTLGHSQLRSRSWFPSQPSPSYWLPRSTRQSQRLVTEFLQLHRTPTVAYSRFFAAALTLVVSSQPSPSYFLPRSLRDP
jgi:hypothetical protein